MRIRLAAIALLFAISSNARADLRTFDVDFRYRQEVYDALRDLLVNDPQNLAPGMVAGRVELLASGQILVNAAPTTLDQVEQLIEAIRERPVEATPRVSLRYWAVLGTAAPSSSAKAIGTGPPPVLNDVLAELKRLNGDLTFRVLGSAAVTTDSGQEGEVTANTMSVTQVTQVQGEMLNAYMRINVQGTAPPPNLPAQFTVVPAQITIDEIELRATLRRGEFVVLGESQMQGGDAGGGPVFYIVHWANE